MLTELEKQAERRYQEVLEDRPHPTVRPADIQRAELAYRARAGKERNPAHPPVYPRLAAVVIHGDKDLGLIATAPDMLAFIQALASSGEVPAWINWTATELVAKARGELPPLNPHLEHA